MCVVCQWAASEGALGDKQGALPLHTRVCVRKHIYTQKATMQLSVS